MTLFLAGLAIFLGAHLFVAVARGARDGIAASTGESAFKGLFSLVSAVGFALIIIGWRNADASVVYTPPSWGRHANYLFMLLSLIALAAAYAPKGRIAATLKHPMLVGVKLWAFGHLLANGEMRSLILFGSFLAFAVIDRIAVKRRGAPTPAPGPAVNDAIAVVAGVAAWAGIYFFAHRYIAGVPLT